LHHFGLAVQILDDLNDLGQDLAGRRQSYFASEIAYGADAGERDRLAALEGDQTVRADADLWRRFPKGLVRTQRECLDQFRNGIDLLCRGGLPLGRTERAAFLGALAAVVKRPTLAVRLRAR
jgi:galactokinase